MIGRGALGNPWIFNGKSPGVNEIIMQVKEHLDLMIKDYGERAIILMRKHIVKYIHGVRNAAKVRREIVTVSNRDELFKILDTLDAMEESA